MALLIKTWIQKEKNKIGGGNEVELPKVKSLNELLKLLAVQEIETCVFTSEHGGSVQLDNNDGNILMQVFI